MIFRLIQVDNFVSGPISQISGATASFLSWQWWQWCLGVMATLSPLMASICRRLLQRDCVLWVSLTQCCSAAVLQCAGQTGSLLCIYNVLSRGNTIWVTRIHCSSIVQRMNKAMENLSFINFLFLCAIIFYFMKIYYSHHVAIPLLLHLSPLAPSSVISAIGTVCGTDSPNSWKHHWHFLFHSWHLFHRHYINYIMK